MSRILVLVRHGQSEWNLLNLFTGWKNPDLTEQGIALERRLSETQRARMRAAYRAAGPHAVAGFRQVLEAMMDRDTLRQYKALKDLQEPT